MKKPINFEKIVTYAASTEFTVVLANPDPRINTDAFWVSSIDETIHPLLFVMDWKNEKIHIRVCGRWSGYSGIWYDTYLPIPKSAILTVYDFYSEICVLYKSYIELLQTNTGYADYVREHKYPINLTNIPFAISVNRSYVVKSTNGNDNYIVKITTDGDWDCTCPAYMYSKLNPKTCKHIDKIKSEIK